MDMDVERFKFLSISDPDPESPSQRILSPPPTSSNSSSPSSRLPIELLSEIFLLCVGSVMDARHTIHMPLLVSKICSRWRSAAIANPKLWSRLFLELTLPGPTSSSPSSSRSSPSSAPSGASQKNIVETWLTRSGACPLTIYVLWEDSPSSFTHPVLDALAQHCTRWHTMFFYLPFPAFRSFSCIRNRLPMLTELSLGMNDLDMLSGAMPGEIDKVDMFENAPCLRSLECVNFSPTMFEFPWDQLQDIPLLAVTIDEALDILRRAKRLVKVGFIFVEVGNPSAPWHPTLHPSSSSTASHDYIDHNHLRCFTLMTPRWNETISLRPLFPHLAFPRLESLTICNLQSAFGPEFTQFLSQLHVLKTLHLRRTALSDEQLVDGLKYLPLLTSLIVHSSDEADSKEPEPTVTQYLFGALTRNFFSSSSMDEDGMLLPRLKTLEMTFNGHLTPAALDTLLEMLQSRLREDGVGVVRLENIRLRSSVDLDEEFLIRLIELRDFGLAVFIEDATEHSMAVREIFD